VVTLFRTRGRGARFLALGLALSMVSPILAGCGRGDVNATNGPGNAGMNNPAGPGASVRGDRSTYSSGQQERRQGLSTKQKVAILAGAAALYYMYNRHKNKQGAGKQGQYYLSKNGRVYYRDQNGNPVWVTPPREGIQVPAEEAEQYSRFRGYNGRNTGEMFGGYGAGNEAVAGGPPGPGGY